MCDDHRWLFCPPSLTRCPACRSTARQRDLGRARGGVPGSIRVRRCTACGERYTVHAAAVWAMADGALVLRRLPPVTMRDVVPAAPATL